MSRKKRIIILGLGDSGVLVAQGLARDCDVTVITPRPYFLSSQNVGGRLAWPSAWERIAKIGVSQFKRLDDVDIVQGLATGIDLAKSEVTSRTGEGDLRTDGYDALVIATGTENGFWRKTRLESWEQEAGRRAEERAALNDARTIAIIGGGASGVSLAASLAERYPDRSVRLYHSGERPLPNYPNRVGQKISNQLQSLGVEILSGYRAKIPDISQRIRIGPEIVEWTTGQPPTKADCVIWAIGNPKPNSGFLPAEILTEDEFVRVEPTLQVEGQRTVFCVGDLAATDQHRCSARNGGADIVVTNIKSALDLSNKPLKHFRAPKYKWGEVVTSPSVGMTLFTPGGKRVQMPDWFVQSVIFNLILFKCIYGGVRKPRR
ncbi:MAG: FAD-dependent oxidoreductase [Pseudomonadota bacterium]